MVSTGETACSGGRGSAFPTRGGSDQTVPWNDGDRAYGRRAYHGYAGEAVR